MPRHVPSYTPEAQWTQRDPLKSASRTYWLYVSSTPLSFLAWNLQRLVLQDTGKEWPISSPSLPGKEGGSAGAALWIHLYWSLQFYGLWFVGHDVETLWLDYHNCWWESQLPSHSYLPPASEEEQPGEHPHPSLLLAGDKFSWGASPWTWVSKKIVDETVANLVACQKMLACRDQSVNVPDRWYVLLCPCQTQMTSCDLQCVSFSIWPTP